MSNEDNRTDVALMRSEQELRLLVDTIPALVWTAGPEGDIEYVNKRVLEYLGATLDEIIGNGWVEKVHPDDVAFKTRTWLANLESRTAHDAVCRFRGADGQYRWFAVSGAPLKAGDGRVLRWYGVLIDIDDRKKAEEALRESEYKLRQIIDTVPGITWSTGSDGPEGKKAEVQPGFLAQVRAILNVLPAYTWYAPPSGSLAFVSKRQADFLGVPEDHPLRFGVDIGAPWDVHIPFLHPDDQEEGRKYWANSLRTGEGYEHDYRVRDAEGNYRWLLTRTEPLRASDGTILLWVGATLDIEELKRAEEGLRESEAKFRDYAETASDWFWETGPDYRFTLLTDNTFGSASASRIGTRCWDHALDLETEPEKWRLLRATYDSRKAFRDFVYCTMGGNGLRMYVSASGKPVFDASGEFRGYRGTCTDVTAIVRAQEEHERLRQLESDLAHINRLSVMGELTASLAHEIAQPIAAARNNARAATHFLDRGPPELSQVREALACIVEDADRAADILDRIRDHIKKAPPRKERVDLNKAINDVIALAQGAIIKNRVSVQTRLTEGPSHVQADCVQMQQVVLNLILNAVEAMNSVEAGPRELLISTEQTQTGDVLVAVRDSGPGIDPSHLERVFDAFYTTKSSGMGMGLSICRSIIDAHAGRLWADVNEPRGAVFQFTLPSAEKELMSSHPAAHQTGEPNGGTVRDAPRQSACRDNKQLHRPGRGLARRRRGGL